MWIFLHHSYLSTQQFSINIIIHSQRHIKGDPRVFGIGGLTVLLSPLMFLLYNIVQLFKKQFLVTFDHQQYAAPLFFLCTYLELASCFLSWPGKKLYCSSTFYYNPLSISKAAGRKGVRAKFPTEILFGLDWKLDLFALSFQPTKTN